MVHNDIGSNGTAGCIGVELGGTSGTKAEQAFLTLYEAVKPTSVKVSIGKGAKKNQSLKPKPRTTPDNVPVSEAAKNKSKPRTIIMPVEVEKPVPVPVMSNSSGGGVNSSGKNKNVSPLHNIP
jgi:hypothetical protein